MQTHVYQETFINERKKQSSISFSHHNTYLEYDDQTVQNSTFLEGGGEGISSVKIELIFR